ncbi:DUF3857 domain-containing protein [Paraflavitalea pollutisoli]|uniref:DUF3857 domain-containing protein n=1 Tax=Paraflavitalea pollutisoli TaxID=3034143 RepID=UPI0023EA7BEE|nr:DUF3857 domain-containing protein [Paraflavitalea sp. H1-2-19X]
MIVDVVKCKWLPRLLVLLILLCSLGMAQAQPDFETWGKITPEERALTVCAFDSEAVAVVLIDEAINDYNDERHLITYRHIRIKILKEKGVGYSDIEIPFYTRDDFQRIDDLEAVAFSVNAAGQLVSQAVDRKSIYTQPRNELWSQKKFAFPDVKPGTIIEYKYRSEMKSIAALEDWEFQRDLPVVKSKFDLAIPPNYEFAYMVHKSDQMQVVVKPNSNDGKIYFEMNNIPGLRDEPYMDARKDYLQRVTFQLSGYNSGFGRTKYMTSWDEVTKELGAASYFGSQVGKSLSGTEAFLAALKRLPTPEEKMREIYQYTRSNMSWTGFTGYGSSDGVKTAWSKRKGNVAEVNFVLLNLLTEAGLEAYPMLVSTRHHGKVNTQYPFVDQFNATYVAVIIGDKRYYLDATDVLGQPEMIPFDVLNTTAFVVHRKKGGLVNITDDALQFKESVTISLKLDSNQHLQGVAYINSAQYARTERLGDWKRGRDRYLSGFETKDMKIAVDSVSIKNENNDSLPLSQQIQFRTPATATGDYIFVPVNLFSGFETNPFLANNRFSDINFGYRRLINFSTYIEIPAGYVVDALPKSLQVVNSDKTVVFARELFQDANTNKVLARLKIEMKKSLYSVDEYGELKEFYKRMFDMLNEQIVFKKK